MVKEQKNINGIDVSIIPDIGMSVSYRDDDKLCQGTICKVCDSGKVILFKDEYNEIHMAKLSTRKNSIVHGQWIENGITRKICKCSFS